MGDEPQKGHEFQVPNLSRNATPGLVEASPGQRRNTQKGESDGNLVLYNRILLKLVEG